MRYLALDVGERRVGIAVSETGLLAAPHSVLHRRSKKEDFIRLRRLIEELKIDQLVVGLPYSLDAAETMGPQARRIKRYAAALAQEIDIPLHFFDESYSTADAQAYLAGPKPGKRGKAPLDAAAAAVILQKFLDFHVSSQ